MNQSLCCARCGEIVIKSYQEGIKIRSKVVLVKALGTYAVCRGCGEEVLVPIIPDMSIMKSVNNEKKLRLYVKS